MFLGLKLLKLIPIRSLVLGNQAEEQSLEGKISPKGGGWKEMEAKGRVQVDLACRLQRKQNNERNAAVAATEATWSVPLSNDESCKRGHISTKTNPRGGLSLPLLMV